MTVAAPTEVFFAVSTLLHITGSFDAPPTLLAVIIIHGDRLICHIRESPLVSLEHKNSTEPYKLKVNWFF